MKRDYSGWLYLMILAVAIFASSCKKKCKCIYTNPTTGEQTSSAQEESDPCPGYSPSPEDYHKECN